MDWSLKIFRFSILCLILGGLPLLSVSQNKLCAHPFQTIEAARSCYSEFQYRASALDFVLAQLKDASEQQKELELYLTRFDPLSLRARESLLYFRLSEGKTKEVLKEIELIQKLDADFFPPLKAAGILYESGNYQESRKILDQLLRREPGNLEARKLRAVVLFEIKEFAKSYEDLQFFAKNGNITDQGYLIASAKTLFELKERDRAREILQSISLENLTAPQLYSLADLAEKMKEYHLAKQLYHQLLKQKSDLAQVLRFGNLLMRLNNLKEAQDLFDRENQKYSTHEDFILAQVELASLQGKLAHAGNLLEQKLNQFPQMERLNEKLMQIRQGFIDPKVLQALEKRESDSAAIIAKQNQPRELESLPKEVEVVTELPEEVKRIALTSSLPAEKKASENRKPTNIAAEPFRTYRVRKGESLMTFSNRVYGTHQKWKEVFEWNRNKLKSPNHIRPGMKLKVKKEIEGDS